MEAILDLDYEIARHSISRGHWPGVTIDQVIPKINEVRSEHQEAIDLGGGRRAFRKGDLVLIEDGRGSGTLFRPSPKSASRYFSRFVRRYFERE